MGGTDATLVDTHIGNTASDSVPVINISISNARTLLGDGTSGNPYHLNN